MVVVVRMVVVVVVRMVMTVLVSVGMPMSVRVAVFITVVMMVMVVRLFAGHADSPTGARSMRTTAIAAPNPLSMLTTVTPDAQLVSMPSSAVSPSNATP